MHVHTEEFLQTHKKAQCTPQSKYDFPQTEAQEIGWDTRPLVRNVSEAKHAQLSLSLSTDVICSMNLCPHYSNFHNAIYSPAIALSCTH